MFPFSIFILFYVLLFNYDTPTCMILWICSVFPKVFGIMIQVSFTRYTSLRFIQRLKTLIPFSSLKLIFLIYRFLENFPFPILFFSCVSPQAYSKLLSPLTQLKLLTRSLSLSSRALSLAAEITTWTENTRRCVADRKRALPRHPPSHPSSEGNSSCSTCVFFILWKLSHSLSL